MRYKLIVAFLLILGITGCSDDINSKYTTISAHFSYTPVNAIPTLYRACNSMGEFCSITTDGNYFYFRSTSTSDKVPKVQIQGYVGYVLGLGGLILGLPTMPELGESSSYVTCYDLNCSNCYQNYNITKSMTLKEGGFATCPSCNRTYDLNNQGIVSDGESGRALFRYAVYYDGTTVTVNNN